MATAHLADSRWPEVEAEVAGGQVVVALPIGSTEQHGHHLPLSTDTDIASALADRLGEARPDVVVAPPLSYGASGEHASFPGTISLGQEALELVLVEWGRSASDTFSHLVFVNGHGGNAEPVGRAVRRLRAESRAVLAWSPHWDGDAHAGRFETSLQLALDPTRVRLELARAGNPAPLGELMARLRSEGVRPVSPSGVLGDPAGASAEEGEALLEALAADLVASVANWLGTPGCDPSRRSP